WDVAQASLVAALREHQPDGLLGFSQGATAAALLLAHLAEAAPGTGAEATGEAAPPSGAGPLPPLPRLKVAILVAGFMPRDTRVAELVRRGGAAAAVGSGLPLPACLFVTGTTDVLVPSERSLALAACFPPSAVSTLTHGGAHLVPTCSGEFKLTLTAFLDAAAAGGPVPPAHTVQGGASPAAALSASQSAASLASANGAAPEPATLVAAAAAAK
ncbi:Ovarian cancer-associated-like protein 2, partial [Tetrabaena socialis]